MDPRALGGAGEGASATTRTRRARLAPIVTLAALVAFASASLAAFGAGVAAALPPGSISGVVTDASTHAALAGVEVCAELPPPPVSSETEEEGVEEPPPACAPTNAAGQYTIGGLQPGSYWVVFNPPLVAAAGGGVTFSHIDYVAQAFEGAYTEAAAKPVAVASGAAVAAIDAALERGGEIGGRVTASAGGAPLGGALVCAFEIGGEGRLGGTGCTETAPGGEYEIYGLAAGTYRVVFLANGYEPQVYNGHAAFSEATPVQVLAGQLVEGIGAALAVAAPLAAHPGAGSPPPAGAGAPGAPTGSAPLQGTPRMTLASRRLHVRGGRVVTVLLACRGSQRCHGRLELTAPVRVGARTRTMTLGSATFRIAGGARAHVAIRLDGLGRALLAGAGGQLRARLTVTLAGTAGGASQTISVRLADAA
jgi:hypothetical protein